MDLHFDKDDIQEIEDAIRYWKNGGDESYGLHLGSLVIKKFEEIMIEERKELSKT